MFLPDQILFSTRLNVTYFLEHMKYISAPENPAQTRCTTVAQDCNNAPHYLPLGSRYLLLVYIYYLRPMSGPNLHPA